MLADEQLAEIEARLNAATRGPWVVFEKDIPTNELGQQKFGSGLSPKKLRVINTAWEHGQLKGPVSITQLWISPFYEEATIPSMEVGDAQFIAHAPADIAALLEEVRRLREADVDPMVAVKAYEAAHGGRSFTFRRDSNIFSHSGATAQEAWANAGMPADEFESWSWYEIQVGEVQS